MDYMADTVAIIRHFSKTGKIGKKAREILQQADEGFNTIWVSVISIAEIMYLAERNRIVLNFENFCKTVDDLNNYKIIDLNIVIVLIANQFKELELHDRLILVP